MHSTPPNDARLERRKGSEWINPRHLGIAPRRRNAPQPDANRNRYVDLYEPIYMAVAAVVLLCTALDATFTLHLLERGAVELNGLMAFWIFTNPDQFVYFKISLTALALVFLIVHKNFVIFGRLPIRWILFGTAAGYLGLIGYEVVLLNLQPPAA